MSEENKYSGFDQEEHNPEKQESKNSSSVNFIFLDTNEDQNDKIANDRQEKDSMISPISQTEEKNDEYKEEPLKTIDVQFQESDTKNSANKKSKHISNGFFKRHKTAFAVLACGIISVGGGYGGTMLALNSSNVNEVQYQKVIRTAAGDGESANNLSVKDVANLTMNSVVEIKTEAVKNGSYMRQYVTEGAGSGVILTEDGYIVTNNHVIDGATKIQVTTKDGTTYDATLVGKDSKTDLAVLKIDASNLNPVVMGDSSKLEVGDTAIAIGNPLGELGGTVTSGIISALDRTMTIDNQEMTLLQTNAAINPGNSGGGLFNSAGELIGIVNAKSSGSDVEGLGFAIPVNIAKDVIENLINNGYVSGRPQLGVSVVEVSDASTALQYGVNKAGIYIAQITSGSSADNAGLEAGDRLISIDDQEISSVSDVKKIIDEKAVGDTIEIQYSRNEKVQKVKVTLQESKPTEES